MNRLWSDVFPASAGMNRYEKGREKWQGGVPRIRGDEPIDVEYDDGTEYVFPAPAGMNLPVYIETV